MKLMEYLEKEGVRGLTDTGRTFIDLYGKPKYVMYDYCVNSVVHGFVVVKVSGEREDLYYEYDDDGANEFSQDINLADVYLYGSVKWDGCSNWMYPDQEDNTMLHFCSMEEARLVAEVMSFAYRIAEEQIDNFEG